MPRKRREVEAYQTYVFQIDEVRPSYSLGLNEGRSLGGTYDEYLHIEFIATCISPQKYEARQTRLLFMGIRSLAAELAGSNDAASPLCVGSLTMRGDRSEYLGSIPFDAALAVPQFALAGGARIIYLHGTAMRYGSARIRYAAFYRDIDLSEL